VGCGYLTYFTPDGCQVPSRIEGGVVFGQYMRILRTKGPDEEEEGLGWSLYLFLLCAGIPSCRNKQEKQALSPRGKSQGVSVIEPIPFSEGMIA
jgi:hypothetical protein